MRYRKESQNYSERKDPDCATCIRWRTCERAAENSFCTMWQSREPEKREPDPNKLWEQGEEVDFD